MEAKAGSSYLNYQNWEHNKFNKKLHLILVSTIWPVLRNLHLQLSFNKFKKLAPPKLIKYQLLRMTVQ
jgi:hypothetical protein